MNRGSPIAPGAHRARRAAPGRARTGTRCRAGARHRRRRRRAASRAPRARSRANGFSHSTCFPAATASSTIAACVCGGVVTATTSTSSRANASARSVVACGMPKQRGALRGLVGIAADQRAHLDAGGVERACVGDDTEAGADDGCAESGAHAVMLPDPGKSQRRVPPMAYLRRSAIRLGRPSCAPPSTTSPSSVPSVPPSRSPRLPTCSRVPTRSTPSSTPPSATPMTDGREPHGVFLKLEQGTDVDADAAGGCRGRAVCRRRRGHALLAKGLGYTVLVSSAGPVAIVSAVSREQVNAVADGLREPRSGSRHGARHATSGSVPVGGFGDGAGASA